MENISSSETQVEQRYTEQLNHHGKLKISKNGNNVKCNYTETSIFNREIIFKYNSYLTFKQIVFWSGKSVRDNKRNMKLGNQIKRAT